MYKGYNLKPIYANCKSFYGKAKVTDLGDLILLQSYKTTVCAIKDGRFIRIWNGYSATTMRHINEFIAQNDIPGGGKKWWDDLTVERVAVGEVMRRLIRSYERLRA